ncbi:MAG: DUF4406 domain-containing protein [Coriobacteriales bacterium]|nr:DUF4406 domain-containing protein [Coriobacteriales bacterium]
MTERTGKRAFLSFPMRGASYDEVRAQWAAHAEHVRETWGYEAVDSICTEFADNGDGRALYYLGHSIQVMSRADVAVFLGGWESADGCRVEHMAALLYGVPVVYGPGTEGDHSGMSEDEDRVCGDCGWFCEHWHLGHDNWEPRCLKRRAPTQLAYSGCEDWEPIRVADMHSGDLDALRGEGRDGR